MKGKVAIFKRTISGAIYMYIALILVERSLLTEVY